MTERPAFGAHRFLRWAAADLMDWLFGVWLNVLWLLLLLHTGRLAATLLIHYYDAATRARSAPPPLAAYIRVGLSEWCYSLLSFGLLPFGFGPVPRPEIVAGGGAPIILVPGYGANRAKMAILRWRLSREGFGNVFSVSLGRTMDPIPDLAVRFVAAFEAIAAQTSKPITVIAHSMGGLVVRRALADRPDLPVDRFVTLGTPHEGTRMAVFSIGASGRQMLPRSDFLRQLGKAGRDRTRSIVASIDNIVVPSKNAKFGSTVQVDGIGHDGLVHSRRVFEKILVGLGPT